MLLRWLLPVAFLFSLLPPMASAQGVPSYLGSVLRDATAVGSGSFRWFGLKIYDATLWAERGAAIGEDWRRTPLVLELNYARSLVGSKIADASVDEMKKLGIGSPARLEAWRTAMRDVFPDVEDGTRLSGAYRPGQAMQFYRDGQPIGEIADPEFGAAFFAIWLHPKTSAPKLRAALLGQ